MRTIKGAVKRAVGRTVASRVELMVGITMGHAVEQLAGWAIRAIGESFLTWITLEKTFKRALEGDLSRLVS